MKGAEGLPGGAGGSLHTRAHHLKQRLVLRYNQDRGCFACCTDTGVRIYNVDPLVEKARFGSDELGPVILCEMLYRTNILFLVTEVDDRVLRIYDDAERTFVCEVEFPSSVRGIRAQKDKVGVALDRAVYVMNWPVRDGSRCRLAVHTSPNPDGIFDLAAMPTAPRRPLVAPAHSVGSVQLMDVGSFGPVSVLRCHDGALRCMALSTGGALLATASERGTLLRVWCTKRKGLLHTLRRGADHATLFCLNFSRGGDMLCCCSDKGTLHVFQLGGSGGTGTAIAAASEALLGGERPFASASVPKERAALCAFVSNTTVAAICADGTFHKYVFTNEGSCYREAFDIFLELGEDDDFII